MQDLTAIYYTANTAPKKFLMNLRIKLSDALGDYPLVVIKQDPSIPRSHLQIYRNALEGAKQATTEYIALCEDDVLYHKSHFNQRPTKGRFAYNMNVWALFTWSKPAIFNYKDRINLSGLICERKLFIEAMEERFAKYPDDSKVNLGLWAEPGKYERQLGVTERVIEKFFSDFPNVAFSHETALGFLNLGKRKKMGQPRAVEIPYWGRAVDVINLYE